METDTVIATGSGSGTPTTEEHHQKQGSNSSDTEGGGGQEAGQIIEAEAETGGLIDGETDAEVDLVGSDKI